MHAGELNRRILVQERTAGQDAVGQPVDTWVDVGKLWAAPKNETGMGIIRSQREPGVPSSVARYSFKVRRGAYISLGVNVGMRILHDGKIFDIKIITEDLSARDAAYIVCEQGGSDG